MSIYFAKKIRSEIIFKERGEAMQNATKADSPRDSETLHCRINRKNDGQNRIEVTLIYLSYHDLGIMSR